MKNGLLLRSAALALAALMLGHGGDVRAADPPTAPAAPAAPAGAAKDATTKAAATKDVAAKDAAPGPKPADTKASPLHFEPTEKTRADFEVSFPTDI
jgi:hypothetical protein